MSTFRKADELLRASLLLVFLMSATAWNCVPSVFGESFSAPYSHPSTHVIVIPFQYVRGHIFLHLDLDGTGLKTIMLDTGFITNQRTIIVDDAVARRLRLHDGEKDGLTAMGANDIETRKIEDIDVRLNENVVVRSSAQAVSLSLLSHALDLPLDGIIGFAFLRDYVAEIDYTHSLLLLYAPAHYRYHGDGIRIPMQKLRPVIQAKVILPDGKEEWMQLLVDTGSDSQLLFYRHFIDRHAHSLASRDLYQTTYIGLGGQYTCDVVRLRKLQFGNDAWGYTLMFDAPYVDLARMTGGASGKSHLDGHMGNSLLLHANAIFDSLRRQFILEPTQKPAPPRLAMN